jgi:hypothetical protein
MSVIPNTKVGKIEFAENHVVTWTANALPMGSSVASVTSWSGLVTAARTAYTAHLAAQSAAKDATITLDLAIKAMSDATASIIKQVRAKADLAGNGVYALASLPIPAAPSPVPPPGTPTNFKISLAQSGALTLKWKCPNPAGGGGTFYQIARRIGATGAFIPQTGVGSRTYTDATIPAGTASVTYQVTAVRTTAVGPTAEFTVNFGTGAGGEMTASVVAATVAGAPKLAA